ncbi:hypothetical protein [Rathayibacter iranicus]|uniref:Uncharacterized protein n=1 Tax=Rathayibacter iranicus TaxID=59737 RepID=A0AAD2JG04_9MICO|nr:hypothetical protein [Rathayibacter iranicus]AZZ55009.1 hypothetical protein C7V51_03230 [Rathayibacter iranicus]MWV32268.1 hypothetical protein [Rathayibacter iranicus NCPPB 2253 = VKM Ac-1602]PPI62393.1 hypothetical protein C5E08_03235 [Rathayibacter iranicus]
MCPAYITDLSAFDENLHPRGHASSVGAFADTTHSASEGTLITDPGAGPLDVDALGSSAATDALIARLDAQQVKPDLMFVSYANRLDPEDVNNYLAGDENAVYDRAFVLQRPRVGGAAGRPRRRDPRDARPEPL